MPCGRYVRVLLLAHITWLQIDEDFRSIFGRFVELLEAAGHQITLIIPVGDPDDWLGADAYIVGWTGYVLRDPITASFSRELDAGKRVLFLLHDTSANQLLEQRFGLALTSERHFDISRWDDPHWGSGRDRIVARPGDATARIDTLLNGVQKVMCEHPYVVRCFDDAKPLLIVKCHDLVDRLDQPPVASDNDTCVATTAGPQGKAPQVVLFGTGTFLIDEYIEVESADSRRLAENIGRWLSGGRSDAELAAEFHTLFDEIDVTLTPLIIHRLSELHGSSSWSSGLSETRRQKIADRRPNTPIEQALDLSDKVAIIFNDPMLFEALGRLGNNSKTKSRSQWNGIVDPRHRVSHPDRLVKPITEDMCDSVREIAQRVRDAYSRNLASLDDDPRQFLPGRTRHSQVRTSLRRVRSTPLSTRSTSSPGRRRTEGDLCLGVTTSHRVAAPSPPADPRTAESSSATLR
jgi:hypothetical protein